MNWEPSRKRRLYRTQNLIFTLYWKYDTQLVGWFISIPYSTSRVKILAVRQKYYVYHFKLIYRYLDLLALKGRFYKAIFAWWRKQCAYQIHVRQWILAFVLFLIIMKTVPTHWSYPALEYNFKCFRQACLSVCVCVCRHVTTRERLKGISWHLVLGSFTAVSEFRLKSK
jgi:hypothetical protein